MKLPPIVTYLISDALGTWLVFTSDRGHAEDVFASLIEEHPTQDFHFNQYIRLDEIQN